MIQVFIMNSFATTPEGGNPAGVVLRSDFSEKEMLKIASIAGFSETAFLNRVDGSHYEIRFFTPAAEVDLCGHATIAAFSLLKKQELLEDGNYFLSTKAGEIDINVAVLALVILILSGVIAGAFPAMKASVIQPIDAIRNENIG